MQTSLATPAPRPITKQSKLYSPSDYFSGANPYQAKRTADLDALLGAATKAYSPLTGHQPAPASPEVSASAETGVDAMYDPMDGIGIALGLRSALLFNVCLGLGGFLAYEAWMFLTH